MVDITCPYCIASRTQLVTEAGVDWHYFPSGDKVRCAPSMPIGFIASDAFKRTAPVKGFSHDSELQPKVYARLAARPAPAPTPVYSAVTLQQLGAATSFIDDQRNADVRKGFDDWCNGRRIPDGLWITVLWECWQTAHDAGYNEAMGGE